VKQIIANRGTMWTSSDRDEIRSLGREFSSTLDHEDATRDQSDSGLESTSQVEDVALDSPDIGRASVPTISVEVEDLPMLEERVGLDDEPKGSLESSVSVAEEEKRRHSSSNGANNDAAAGEDLNGEQRRPDSDEDHQRSTGNHGICPTDGDTMSANEANDNTTSAIVSPDKYDDEHDPHAIPAGTEE
jgi:hypothetical protein